MQHLRLPDVDFRLIRVCHGSQHGGFEELGYQLFRHWLPEGCEITRVEGSGGDDGVEAFAVRVDGTEVGFQAKYLGKLSGKWPQIDKSVAQAFRKHPRLSEYIVCVPLDRNPAHVKVWDRHVEEWKRLARKGRQRRRAVSFTWWGESELRYMLTQEAHDGRLSYWFGLPEFSADFLQRRFDIASKDLDVRYSPERHVQVDADLYLDALWRHARFHTRYFEVAGAVVRAWDGLRVCLTSEDTKALFGAEIEELSKGWSVLRGALGNEPNAPLLGPIAAPCDELGRAASSFRDALRRKQKETGPTAKNQWGERPFSGEVYYLREFIDSLDTLRYFAEHYDVADGKHLLIHGEAGSGKSHLVAEACERALREGRVALLVLGEYFTSDADPAEQLVSMVGWSRTFDALLSALDVQAEVSGHPGVICIDALNETTRRGTWLHRLVDLGSRVCEYPHLRLVVTCRSDFLDLTIPEPISQRRDPGWRTAMHTGFGHQRFKAVETYFAAYGVQADHFPPLLPEFDNPLFLKTVCEAYQGDRLPGGPIAIVQIRKRLLDRVCQTIQTRIGCPGDVTRRAVETIVDKMVEQGAPCIPRALARTAVDADRKSVV
jgi:hypothetical protein